MKKKYYKIVTDEQDLYSDDKYDSFESLLESFQVYDINPPFKIVGNDKHDYTKEFMSFMKMANYKFLSMTEISKFIPVELQTKMNELWKKEFTVKTETMVDSPFVTLKIKLIPVEDLKSVDCFMNLWEQNILTIARADGGNYFVAIATGTQNTKVFIIDADLCSQNVCKDLIVGWNSIKSFLNSIK